jgi:hypothetical protein
LVRVDGLEAVGWEGSVDYGAGVCERGDGSGSQHLHRDIAERRCFYRSGYYRTACGVGSELIEQAILRSTADDAYLFELRAG